MQIQLQRCLLRPWKEEDAAALVRHANNRKIWRNLRALPHPYTIEHAVEFIAKAQEATPVRFFAIDVADEAVGSIGFSPLSDIHARTAEIGYFVGESHWNRGIAGEALEACSRYAFRAYELWRLQACVFEWSRASMRVLEKCGYVREGVLQKSVWKDGEMIDSMLYARLRE